MEKLWSKRFFSEVLSLLPFEKGVIVGTTFGATYINLKGSKEISWKLGRGVTSSCFVGNELVLGTGFPGSLVFLEGTRISRVLRTKGSVNAMLEYEKDLIAGTGFLRKAFSEGMYLSKYVHFEEGWERHKEEVEGMAYRVTMDLDLLWKTVIPGIVASMKKLGNGILLIHAVYDILALMELKEGRIEKVLSVKEPIKRVEFLGNKGEIWALTTKSLIRYDLDLNEVEREEGSNLSTIASDGKNFAIAEKGGKIRARFSGFEKEYYVDGKPEDIRIVGSRIFGILERKKTHYAFLASEKETSEHLLKGEPIGIGEFEGRAYVGTRGRVYCFRLRKKHQK